MKDKEIISYNDCGLISSIAPNQKVKNSTWKLLLKDQSLQTNEEEQKTRHSTRVNSNWPDDCQKLWV